jgi:hypothetical protein
MFAKLQVRMKLIKYLKVLIDVKLTLSAGPHYKTPSNEISTMSSVC